jgi:hypothetical protein
LTKQQDKVDTTGSKVEKGDENIDRVGYKLTR